MAINHPKLNQRKLEKANINYYWYWDSPGVGVNSDNFKIVYEGLIYNPEDGNYWFRVEVDDIFKMRIYDFYDDGVTVRVRFEPYYSEKVGMLAVTGFRAESRPGGEVRFSWDRHPFASKVDYEVVNDT